MVEETWHETLIVRGGEACEEVGKDIIIAYIAFINSFLYKVVFVNIFSHISTEVGQMSFWWDVKETSLKLLEDFLLDFHFLWSNAREDGTQRQSHWGNSNVHQSNDNLQSSFNSVSHFWRLWENSFCKLTLRTRAKTRSKSRRPGVRTQMWTTETRAKTKAQTKAKGTAKIAEKTL